MQVYPVINCLDEDCFRKKFGKLPLFLPEDEFIHVDIGDAIFTHSRTWLTPDLWKELDAKSNFKVKLEVHLMVEEPEKNSEDWLKAGAKRIVIHVERARAEVAKRIKNTAANYGAEVMVALVPETPVEEMKQFFDCIDFFQVLAVDPGPAAQRMLPNSIDKIKFLRAETPNSHIEVDGGIDYETTRLVKMAGADIVVSGTFIFKEDDPKWAYEDLRQI